MDDVVLGVRLLHPQRRCSRGPRDLCRRPDGASRRRALPHARGALAVPVHQERRRFSRDLHDVLGQGLSAIALKGDLACALLAADPARACRETQDLIAVADSLLRDLPEVTHADRPTSFVNETRTAAQLLRDAGIDVRIDDDLREVDAETDAVLGWAVREGTTNALRHSAARQVQLRAGRTAGRTWLELVNDRPLESDSTSRPRARWARRSSPCAWRHRRLGPSRHRRLEVAHRDPGGRHMIRVLVAEDMHLIRGALVALIGLEADMEVVAELERGDTIEATALRVRPDVAVLDIDLPGLDGLAAAQQLQTSLPECQTLILTGLSQPSHLLRALQGKIRGFLPKAAPAAQLADAIRRIAAGERVLDPVLVAAALETGDSPLTARETDVLRVRCRWPVDRRHRSHPLPLPRDRAQLPLERDRQARRPEPNRRDRHRASRRLALSPMPQAGRAPQQ